jgi:phosphate transport system permease protein
VLLNLDDASKTVLLDHVQAIATGFGVTDQVMPYELKAAQQYAQFVKIGEYAKFAVVICVAMVGLIFAQKRISQKYRARNHVEKVIRMSLAVCSGVAILTTIGIVMSMLSEALHFFILLAQVHFSSALNGTLALAQQVAQKAAMVYCPCYGERSW